MKLGTDPRLPILSGQDYQRNLYARLYDIFRSHAAAVNAVDDASTQNAADIAELLNNAQWYGKAVGEVFCLRDDLAGVVAPPTNNAAFRFIKLTAGDAYNTGALTTESVTGTAPLVVATAVISLAGSPLNGQTVNLWNTERRIPRAGSSGVLQDGANMAHTHAITDPGHAHGISDPGHGHGIYDPGHSHSYGKQDWGAAVVAGSSYTVGAPQITTTGASGTGISINAAASNVTVGSAATGITVQSNGDTETRMRNQGATYYMRIL